MFYTPPENYVGGRVSLRLVMATLLRGGIDYATLRPCGMRFADEIKVLRFAKLGSQTLLPAARGSPPSLKRQHPNPENLGWGVGGGGGIRTHGTFRLSSFQDRRNKL